MADDDPTLLSALMQRDARAGQVVWLGTRPDRRVAMEVHGQIEAIAGRGLAGDRYARRERRTSGKRQVSLIQHEHIEAIASMIGWPEIDPAQLRRNIVVRGFNLLSLKERRFRLGGAVLEYSGLCAPCSYMEEVLGEGGYNAMRGHGGIVARVVEGGLIGVGDELRAVAD